MKNKIMKILLLSLILVCTFRIGMVVDSKLKKTSFNDQVKAVSTSGNCEYKGNYKLNFETTFGKDFDIEKELDIEKFAIKLNVNENGRGQITVTGDRGLGNPPLLRS